MQLHWEEAFRQAEEAVALDPSDASSLSLLGFLEVTAGYIEKGSRALNEAQALDPLSPYLVVSTLTAAFTRGDDETAFSIARRLAQSGAEYAPIGDIYLARAARIQGDARTAQEHFLVFMKNRLLRGVGQPLVEPVMAAIKSPEARPAAIAAILQERTKDSDVPWFWPLFIIGADEELIDTLRSERARGNPTLAANYLNIAWRVAATSAGTKDRFKDLVKEVGLVAYWMGHGWPDRCRPRGEEDFECR
jgi:hypothetical protein